MSERKIRAQRGARKVCDARDAHRTRRDAGAMRGRSAAIDVTSDAASAGRAVRRDASRAGCTARRRPPRAPALRRAHGDAGMAMRAWRCGYGDARAVMHGDAMRVDARRCDMPRRARRASRHRHRIAVRGDRGRPPAAAPRPAPPRAGARAGHRVARCNDCGTLPPGCGARARSQIVARAAIIPLDPTRTSGGARRPWRERSP